MHRDFLRHDLDPRRHAGGAYSDPRPETWNRPRDERDDERRLYRDHLRQRDRAGRFATDEQSPSPHHGTGAPASPGRGFRGRGPRNYARSDERIREDLCEVLTEDDDIDASDIGIEVHDGVVTLEGTVEERWVKHQVEDMAEACAGVSDVRNGLHVRPREAGPSHT